MVARSRRNRSVTGCPTYEREARESPEDVRACAPAQPTEKEYQPAAAHPLKLLLRLLGSPNIASQAAGSTASTTRPYARTL